MNNVVLLLYILLLIGIYQINKHDDMFDNYNYPILTISVIACNRYYYLNRTLNSLFYHIEIYEKYIQYSILYFDQGTVEREYVIDKFRFDNVFLFNPIGMELSFDTLFSYLHTRYLFLVEEDWVVEYNVEKEIFYPSFILESILILSETNKIYGVVIRETDNFEITDEVNITTKIGKHILYVGLLKRKYAYTNGASIYKTKVLKQIKKYESEKKVSDYFFNEGYKIGFTYKGRKGRYDDIHFQHVMDHIGKKTTTKTSICRISLY